MKSRLFLTIAVIFVVAVWGATFYSIYIWDRAEEVAPDSTAISQADKASSADPKKRNGYGRAIDKSGQFGDSFGAATSLFTGLGLLGVVFAFLQQKEAQIGSENEHRERIALETKVLNAQLRAAEAQEASAKHQEEYNKTQQKILDAQVGTAQYTHALVEQQKSIVWVQSIQAQINALTSLLSTRQIALQQHVMPETFTGAEPTVSYEGKVLTISQLRDSLSREINSITANLANLRQELIDGTRRTSGGANA